MINVITLIRSETILSFETTLDEERGNNEGYQRTRELQDLTDHLTLFLKEFEHNY